MIFMLRGILFLFALISFSVHAEEIDPCKNIAGQWTGIAKQEACLMDAKAKFYRYSTTIRMELHLEEKSSGKCSEKQFDWVYTGTCKKALIALNDFKGTIFDNSIFLTIASNNLTLSLDKSA